MRAPLFYILTVLLIASFNATAQTSRIELAKSEYLNAKNDSSRIEALIDLCDQHYSFSPDSLFKYYSLAKAIENKTKEQEIKIENIYTFYLIKTGEIEKAIAHSDSLLATFPENLSAKIFFEISYSKCNALIRGSKNKEAIENCFELLKKAEKEKDTLSILRTCTLLGWANMEIEKYSEATHWLNKGIKLTNNEELLQYAPALFTNNASCYNNLNKIDSALYFVNRGIYLAKKSENLASVCNGLNIRANINLKNDYFAFAESDLNEALSVREKTGDMFYIVSDMGTLATYYAMRKIPSKGIPIALRAIELSKNTVNIAKQIYLYQTLAENYHVANMKDDYATALLKIIELKDTLYQENSDDALAVLQTRYEVQKKENTILQQQFALEKNKYYIIGSTVVFILISLLIGLLYRNYQHVQKIKMEKLLQEQKVLSREAVIKAEEAERKRIAADLHDNLGSYAAAISANTKYIKEGISDSGQTILQLEENAQNMVTQLSDTIWVLKNEQLPFTSLCDRFKVWMQKLMKNYPSIKYNFREEIREDLIFSPSKMLDLFLIMKECVTNSLKHSEAKEISVNFYSNKNWKIEIIDNGKGFDTRNYHKGSGIENVQHRVKASDWQMDIESAYEKGTKVTINSK